jgi:hypothetical protein
MPAVDERAAMWAAYWALKALPLASPAIIASRKELARLLHRQSPLPVDSRPEPSRRAHLTLVTS